MVADKRKIIRQVAAIYEWLNEQLHSNLEKAGKCETCGKCCDFEVFGHRLFITPPELMYLAENLEGKSLRYMQTSRCPYNQAGKCTIYEYRFTGCRIFCCRGDTDFQSRLSETVLTMLKAVCIEFDIPYLYMPLNIALDGQKDY